MTHLDQIHNLDHGSHDGNYWYSAQDLNLGGSWSEIWNTYIKGLLHGGIRINDFDDSLIWMQNSKTGVITAKYAYDLIISHNLPKAHHIIHSQIWQLNIP